MMEYEQLYAFEAYINNLLMFKYLHDGIAVSVFLNCELSSYQPYSLPDDNGFDCFLTVLDYLFDISEYYPSEYEDICLDDKEFWIKQCNPAYKIDKSTVVFVIMDESLRNPITGIVGESDYYRRYAKMYQIEDGVVLVYDTDCGGINYTGALLALLQSRKQTIARVA